MGEIEVAGKDALAAVQTISTNDAGCAYPWPLKVGSKWACTEGATFPNGWKLRYAVDEGVYLLKPNLGELSKLAGVAALDSESAMAVAEMLSAHPAVAAVHYPGLPDHPGHAVAARQMSAYGGMVSFQLAGGEPAALEVCRRTEIFTLAESLGAVESLIEHPGRMTHASVAGTGNEVPGDLVRLSVGIEDVEDLLADLDQALDAAT